MAQGKFTVALTADFFDSAGHPKYQDTGFSVLDAQPHISRRVFAEHRAIIARDQIEGAHGVIVMTPAVTAESVAGADELLAIGRFGVGYDSVDIEACTAADVLVYITPGAVNYPVAEATLGWLIALTHHTRVKDALVRTGRWHDRANFMGSELRERTLGLVGLGGIARTLLGLLQPFRMNTPLVYDPFLTPEQVAGLGVKLVDLPALLRSSDFISIHCPLTETTRGLIGAQELALVKPSAFLVNTARGGIVDEDALFEVLKTRRISGAAIDCFANEPVTSPHRFGQLDNVLLAPHSIAWTNELFRDIGRMACQGMVDLSLGRTPVGVVNPDVLKRPGFQTKWRRIGRFSIG